MQQSSPRNVCATNYRYCSPTESKIIPELIPYFWVGYIELAHFISLDYLLCAGTFIMYVHLKFLIRVDLIKEYWVVIRYLNWQRLSVPFF